MRVGDVRSGGIRFNRNIVECKATPNNRIFINISDLIETSWNVKMDTTLDEVKAAYDLIETSWNVK